MNSDGIPPKDLLLEYFLNGTGIGSYLSGFIEHCKQHSVADDQNRLTQFELAIVRKSNLFRCSLLHETNRYIDLNSIPAVG